MPRGIPNAKPPTSAEAASIKAAIAELQERLARLSTQDKDRAALVRWLSHRPALTKKDVRAVADQMNRHGGFASAVMDAATVKRAKRGGGRAPSEAKGKVGKAVRAARLAKGWSTAELGDRAGTGSGYISQIERGQNKPGPTLQGRLAEALGIPATALANGDARP